MLTLALGMYFGTQPFRVSRIYFARDYPTSIVLDRSLVEQIKPILAQPFSYLDRGRQSFVFISADNQYVLKFFDSCCLEPCFFSLTSEARLEQKYQRLFSGYEVAYLRDQDNTGVICAKLGANLPSPMDVTLIDRLGLHHCVSLQQVPFVLQHVAVPTRVKISEWLDQGDVRKAKNALCQLVEMYVDEYELGLRDRDRNLMHNTGFIGEKPVRIDAGRLFFHEELIHHRVMARDLKKIFLGRVGKWLNRHYPKYRDEILADMQLELEKVCLQLPGGG